MTKEEILEGNKLIAKFLEISVQEVKLSKDVTLLAYGEEGEMPDWVDIQYFQPNADWNELNDVVEKISNVCSANNHVLYREFYNNTREELLIFRYPKDKTWDLCIEFIKWYNQNGISTDSKASNGEQNSSATR